MAESSSHNPSSPKITPKERPVTLDKPESLNPFLPTDLVEFSFDEISLTTNNECLGGKTGGLDQISNKDATILYCLANRVKVYYAKLIWEDIIHKLNKKIREKVIPYPRFISLLLEYIMHEYDNEELTINPTQVFSVHNWGVKPNQTEGPPFTDHMKAICNLDVPVDSKALKPSLQTEEVPQGKKPGAKSGLKRKQSSKHTSESKTEASKSKTGQSKKETQSSSAKDKSPSHPSPPTPVVGEIHKETQQAVGGPTSLRATSEEGAHLQLNSGHDASTNSTTEADPGNSAPNDSILAQQDQTKSAKDGLKTAHTDSSTNEESRADEVSKKIKLEDLSDLLKDTRSAFFTPNSPQDEPITVSDESEEEEVKKDDTRATSHNVPKDTSIPHPPSPKSAQIQKLLAQVQLLQSQKDELEQQKAKSKAGVASLKARPSYLDITQLTDLLLKKHVQDTEIELLGDLKEILTKLETFTSTISSLSSQVVELKNIQWELPAEFQALPSQVSSVQEKLKTLDSLPSLLNKVTDTLNMFATMMENTLGAARNNVPLAGQAYASPVEGEKNTTKDAETNLQNELVDLLGVDMREVVQACPDRKEKGWKTIYGLIKTRMEYLDQTEKELKLDFNKPLKEQDPLNELNELANKKRKRTGDSSDHSRSTKKHKSSVQHEEEVH
ncbi:hypothetical protein Tco_0507929 [Tanacetum coccineum]